MGWLVLVVVAVVVTGSAACPAGFFDSAGVCYACEAGKFSVAGGATVCTVCPANTYQPGRGSTACHAATVCGLGMLMVASATTISDTVCERCPAGFFGNVTGATFCHECPPGYYQDTAGKMFCKEAAVCPPGKYTARHHTAQTDTECAACPPGTFSASVAALGCTACPPDQYQPGTGSTACLPKSVCPAGSYVFSDGTHFSDRTCQLCPPGTFSAIANHRDCYVCEPETFSSADGATACTVTTRCDDREELAAPTTSTDRRCESDSDATASTVQAVFIALGMLMFIVAGGLMATRARGCVPSGFKHTQLDNSDA